MIERKHAGGRPKGRYAVVAIMRTAAPIVVTHKYTTRAGAAEVAPRLNRALPLDDPVIQYCVRPAGRGRV
jgi:hypothetical protein